MYKAKLLPYFKNQSNPKTSVKIVNQETSWAVVNDENIVVFWVPNYFRNKEGIAKGTAEALNKGSIKLDLTI